jgi:hypothetical protein
MEEKIITVPCGSDFLAACASHDRASVEALRASDGRYCSPMAWKDGQYTYSRHIPEPATEPAPMAFDEDVEPQPPGFPSFDSPKDDADDGNGDEEEDDDRAYQDWLARASRLDLDDIVARTCDRIAGKDGTPLHHLLEAWQADPPPDIDRVAIAPHVAEGLGKWVAIQLARSFSAAMALQED